MMNDLMEKLEWEGTEEELLSVFSETGYDLVPVEPTPEEPMEEGMGDEEEMPGDEGPTEGEQTLDLMEEMMPEGDAKGPVAGIRLETMRVANKTMEDDRKKGGKDKKDKSVDEEY
tara:strand:+ start:645 stop:989 length:345 start_codon:yes stop_codon:yes gene_type:complete